MLRCPCTPCRGGTEGFWGPKSPSLAPASQGVQFQGYQCKENPWILGEEDWPEQGVGGSCSGSGHGVSAPHPFPMGLQVDGVSYLLQEIYGIENKYNTQDSKVCACIPRSSLIPSSLPLAQVWPLKRAQGKSLQHSTELVLPGDILCWHRSCWRQKMEGLSFPPHSLWSFHPILRWGLDGEHGAQSMGCALRSALICKNWGESLGFCFLWPHSQSPGGEE